MIVGIDPGCSGALALLDDGVLVDWLNIEAVSSRIVVRPVVDFLNRHGHQIVAVHIETVHSMPRQGVSSVFTFGRSFGCLEGIVETLMFPQFGVTPQQWKRKFGFVGKDKDAVRVEAMRRWPQADVLSKKGKGGAVADAAFIALWGAS
jgi:crossover junction endodeoxyribonuclease RuvC